MAKVLNNLLSDYGYNLVALPKEDISPLMLLYKNGDGVVAAVEDKIQNFFKPEDKAVPVIKRNKDVTGMEGKAEVVFNAEAGVDVLDWLLKKLNMGKLSAKFKVNANHTVKIRYEEVKEDKVSLLSLDEFITGSKPDAGKFGTFSKKLENNQLLVINNVLKSNSFSIAVEDANGQSVDIEASVKGIVDANVDISKNKNNQVTLKHKNKITPLVFAFKAQQILYDQKKWWQVFKKDEAGFHIKDQKGVVLRGEEDYPTVPLNAGTSLIDI